MLSDRYPVESLSVSPAELRVFSTVHLAACTVKWAVEEAQNLCGKRGLLANDMQQVYEEWVERCAEWKQSRKADKKIGGSQGSAE